MSFYIMYQNYQFYSFLLSLVYLKQPHIYIYRQALIARLYVKVQNTDGERDSERVAAKQVMQDTSWKTLVKAFRKTESPKSLERDADNSERDR